METVSKQIMTAKALPATGSVNSIGMNLEILSLGSIQAVWTGSPTGSLQVQVSNDIVPIDVIGTDPASKVVNWINYTAQILALSGTAGNTMFMLSDIGYSWVRLNYTATSGTGVMNAIFVGKGN